MAVLAQQRLMLVLAVDVDEQLADVAQITERGRPTIDVGASAALPRESAAERTIFAFIKLAGLWPGQSIGQMADDKERADIGALGSRPYHAAIGTVAQAQAERIHEDGFTGAGFAGDHRKSRGKLQLEVLHDGKLTDFEQAQHGDIPQMTDRNHRSGPRASRCLAQEFFPYSDSALEIPPGNLHLRCMALMLIDKSALPAH